MQAGALRMSRVAAAIPLATLRSTDDWHLYFLAVFFAAIGADPAHFRFPNERKEFLA